MYICKPNAFPVTYATASVTTERYSKLSFKQCKLPTDGLLKEGIFKT